VLSVYPTHRSHLSNAADALGARFCDSGTKVYNAERMSSCQLAIIIIENDDIRTVTVRCAICYIGVGATRPRHVCQMVNTATTRTDDRAPAVCLSAAAATTAFRCC